MAKVIQAELKLKYKEAVKNLDEMQKEYSKLEKQIEDTDKTAKKSEKGFSSLSKGIKGMGTAFKAAGIGVVVALFGALAAALSKNQQVMDTVAVVTGTISQVFAEIGNVLVNVYNSVSSATENFDALGRVVSNVFKIAIAPFKLAIDGLALGFYNAQLAWEQSFLGSGDTEKIEALNSKIDETKQSLIDTTVGVVEAGTAIATDFSEAVSEVGNIGSQVAKGLSEISIKSISDNVKANEQLKKAAAEARIVNQGLIEQYDRQAEQQRQIRDNDLKSIDDRIAANDNLKATLDEQKESMLANADLMIQQAELQFNLSGLEEDRLALLEARNEKKAIEAQIEGFMSEQESNRVALLKEKMELELSNDEATALRQNEERNFNAEMQENEVTRIQTMLDNLEITHNDVATLEENTEEIVIYSKNLHNDLLIPNIMNTVANNLKSGVRYKYILPDNKDNIKRKERLLELHKSNENLSVILIDEEDYNRSYEEYEEYVFYDNLIYFELYPCTYKNLLHLYLNYYIFLLIPLYFYPFLLNYITKINK